MGTDDDYLTFQRKVLKWERDNRVYGVRSDQRLANALATRATLEANGISTPNPLMDGSFAVTQRQAWRGSGFAPRGRGGRGGHRSNRGRVAAPRAGRGYQSNTSNHVRTNDTHAHGEQ